MFYRQVVETDTQTYYVDPFEATGDLVKREAEAWMDEWDKVILMSFPVGGLPVVIPMSTVRSIRYVEHDDQSNRTGGLRKGDRVKHNVKPHWTGTVVSFSSRYHSDDLNPVVDWDNDDLPPRPAGNLSLLEDE